MRVTVVVAVGDNGVIGAQGAMPWGPTGDQQQFKQLTWGHPIVMGRATYDSIGRPLPGRTSVVLTRDTSWSIDGVEVAHDLRSVLALAAELDDEVFVIGGDQVYRAVREADVVDRMVVTHVHQSPDGDAFFDPIDPELWSESGREAFDGYDIATYVRRPRDLHS